MLASTWTSSSFAKISRANFPRLFASQETRANANVEQSSAADRSPHFFANARDRSPLSRIPLSKAPSRSAKWLHAYEEIIAIMLRARTVVRGGVRNAMQQFFLSLHDSRYCNKRSHESTEYIRARITPRTDSDGIPLGADNFRASSSHARKSEKTISRRANPRDCTFSRALFPRCALYPRTGGFFPLMSTLILFRLADARADACCVRQSIAVALFRALIKPFGATRRLRRITRSDTSRVIIKAAKAADYFRLSSDRSRRDRAAIDGSR